MTNISAQAVRQLFDYRDGLLYWRARPIEAFASRRAFAIWNKRFPGKLAGHLHKTRIDTRRKTVVTINGATDRLLASRLIWAWHRGEWPSGLIDHEDGNTLNDLIENLRDVPHAVNSQNARMHVDNTSGVTGVSWQKTKGKWKAEIMAYGVKKHIGVFDDFGAAVAARKTAERDLGFHPNHGRATHGQA